MKSIKTSALPKMKGLIFHLETSRVPYVITSPGQTSAMTSFLRKNSQGCFNFLFSRVVKYPPLLLSLFQCAAQASETHGLQDYISSHFQTTPLPPHFLRLVCLQIVKPEQTHLQGHQLLCLTPYLPHPHPSLKICIHALLQPLSRTAFPQLFT